MTGAATAGTATARPAKAVTVHTPGGIAVPHAQQAVRITRIRTTGGKTSREIAYLTVSLPAADAQPTDLQDWARREWLIENTVHHVRDVTFREDLRQARTVTGPAVMATPRSATAAPTATPTSPAQPAAPTAARTISSTP
ncbi:hypothetical protein [Micromonospora sp. NPDC005206]|uniref:hypothetical protein n=1 Tax=Micromonospora sp. NPDC005206 TaxID=3157022 RepID=UPI0033BC014C